MGRKGALDAHLTIFKVYCILGRGRRCSARATFRLWSISLANPMPPGRLRRRRRRRGMFAAFTAYRGWGGVGVEGSNVCARGSASRPPQLASTYTEFGFGRCQHRRTGRKGGGKRGTTFTPRKGGGEERKRRRGGRGGGGKETRPIRPHRKTRQTKLLPRRKKFLPLKGKDAKKKV